MKNSSKILLTTFVVLIVVIALDFTKNISLLHKAIFIAATGVLALVFQKIGGYYANNPLKAPRFIRRQILDEEVLKNLQNLEEGTVSLECKIDTLREELEKMAIRGTLSYKPEIIAQIGDHILRSASRMDTSLASLASPVVKKGGGEIDQA